MPLQFLAWNSPPLDFSRITVIIIIISNNNNNNNNDINNNGRNIIIRLKLIVRR